MSEIRRVLSLWKHRTKLSIFNIYWQKANGDICSIHASWQTCYDEDEVVKAMQAVEKDESFKKWLEPQSEELVEHFKNNMI